MATIISLEMNKGTDIILKRATASGKNVKYLNIIPSQKIAFIKEGDKDSKAYQPVTPDTLIQFFTNFSSKSQPEFMADTWMKDLPLTTINKNVSNEFYVAFLATLFNHPDLAKMLATGWEPKIAREDVHPKGSTDDPKTHKIGNLNFAQQTVTADFYRGECTESVTFPGYRWDESHPITEQLNDTKGDGNYQMLEPIATIATKHKLIMTKMLQPHHEMFAPCSTIAYSYICKVLLIFAEQFGDNQVAAWFADNPQILFHLTDATEHLNDMFTIELNVSTTKRNAIINRELDPYGANNRDKPKPSGDSDRDYVTFEFNAFMNYLTTEMDIQWYQKDDKNKGPYIQQWLQLWHDTLVMEIISSTDDNKVSDKYPKYLQSTHDSYYPIMAGIQQSIAQEAWDANVSISKTLEYEGTVTDVEGNKQDYIVRIPDSVDELNDEAKQQNNCIRSYIKDAANGEIVIAFLRKKDEPDKSWVSIQINAIDHQPICSVLEDYPVGTTDSSIKRYHIYQAYMKNNRNLDYTARKALHDYCKHMNIDQRVW